jgi:hypothetical protein
MITYNSIDGINRNRNLGKDAYSFYKYDGSNLRWEWNKKNGFYKFGTRKRMFDHTDEQFGDAVELFKNNYEEKISKILVDNYRQDKVVIFTEYLGDKSFAGFHNKDDIKRLVLFDVHIIKRGIISPKDFLKLFGDLDFSAEFLGNVRFNQQYIEEVRQNVDGKLNEGVVCKGSSGHNLWMSKIKTLSFLDKLKNTYQKEWEENQKEQSIIF